MKKHKHGFTLVEVTLFLAVTAALFIGLIAGLGSSMEAQRFNDSTQNFAEFMRSIYSQVSNVQSVGNGRSDYAIYGKLVSFGQTTDINGETIQAGDKIFVYDIIGPVSLVISYDNIVAGMNVLKYEENPINGNLSDVELAGQVQSYSPRWGATIEVPDTSYSAYTGSIAIVRHPRSGTIVTLIAPTPINVNHLYNQEKNNSNISGTDKDNIIELLFSHTFQTQELNLCVSPAEAGIPYNMRRNVRIVAGARNASGVEIIDMDSSENECN